MHEEKKKSILLFTFSNAKDSTPVICKGIKKEKKNSNTSKSADSVLHLQAKGFPPSEKAQEFCVAGSCVLLEGLLEQSKRRENCWVRVAQNRLFPQAAADDCLWDAAPSKVSLGQDTLLPPELTCAQLSSPLGEEKWIIWS